MVGGRYSCFPLMQHECACGTYRTYHCILAPACLSPVLLGFVVVPLPSLPYATHMAGFAPVWISHGTAPFLGRCYPLGGASCWSGTDGPAQLFMGCIITSSGHLAVRRCRRMRLCHFVFRDLGMLLVLYLLVPPLVFRVCLACVVCSSSTAYGGWPA